MTRIRPTVAVDCRWLGLGGAGRVTAALVNGIATRDDPFDWVLWGARERMRPEWGHLRTQPAPQDPRSWVGQGAVLRGPRADLTIFMHQMRPIDGRTSITFVYDTIQVDNSRGILRKTAALAYLRLVARASRFVLTPSQWSKSELTRRRIVRPEKVVLVAPALDSNFIRLIRRAREAAPAEPPEQLLCVAGSAPHKGLETLSVAYERTAFRRRGGMLTIVGRRPADIPMAAGIRWLEQPLPDPELARLYANSTCIITPSRAEGFGLPPQEALAAGLPAIVSRGSALAEIEHPNARHFDQNDPDSLTAAIDRISTDVAVRIDSPSVPPCDDHEPEEAFAARVVRVVQKALEA